MFFNNIEDDQFQSIRDDWKLIDKKTQNGNQMNNHPIESHDLGRVEKSRKIHDFP